MLPSWHEARGRHETGTVSRKIFSLRDRVPEFFSPQDSPPKLSPVIARPANLSPGPSAGFLNEFRSQVSGTGTAGSRGPCPGCRPCCQQLSISKLEFSIHFIPRFFLSNKNRIKWKINTKVPSSLFFIYLFSSVANHFNVLIFTKKINMIFHLGIKSSPKIILTGLASDKTSVLNVII